MEQAMATVLGLVWARETAPGWGLAKGSETAEEMESHSGSGLE
jgi:hypothetical protein